MRVAAASATATAQTPATSESDVPPQREVHGDDHDQRQCSDRGGRRGVAMMAMVDFGGVELTSSRGALTHELIFGGYVGGDTCIGSIAFSGAPRSLFRAVEPP